MDEMTLLDMLRSGYSAEDIQKQMNDALAAAQAQHAEEVLTQERELQKQKEELERTRLEAEKARAECRHNDLVEIARAVLVYLKTWYPEEIGEVAEDVDLDTIANELDREIVGLIKMLARASKVVKKLENGASAEDPFAEFFRIFGL